MGRILALGILGTAAFAQIVQPSLAYVFASFGGTGYQTGSVSGTITTGAKGAAPVRLTIDQKICGNELPDEAIVVDAQGRLENAVVILTGVKPFDSLALAQGKRQTADVIIMNEKCRFAPRVQLVRPNASVRTTSKDPILHTTQAQLENGRTIFNVALPMPGLNISKPIGGAGAVRLTCNVHPWMRGWIIVTDDAAAVSGAAGRFSIDNVPPGAYELRVWHESLKGAPQKITVAAGKPTEIGLQLK